MWGMEHGRIGLWRALRSARSRRLHAPRAYGSPSPKRFALAASKPSSPSCHHLQPIMSSSNEKKGAETSSLPSPITAPSPPSGPRGPSLIKTVLLSLCLVPSVYYFSLLSAFDSTGGLVSNALASFSAEPGPMLSKPGASCPVQVKPLSKGNDWDPEKDPDFAKLAIERLIGAVQISYDDMNMDPEKEPRFDIFQKQHDYLENTFPRVYEKLQVEKVARFGLIFTWKGKNEKLKPIVLMAHQDVVPVNPSTRSQWTYDPFSGHLDADGWVWGRGTTDCKNTLIGTLSAVEQLASEDFEPERTIILSFGFDEEIGGGRSARPIAERLEQIYGKNGVAMIVDEGFTGVDEAFGVKFARLGTAEKGAINLDLEVLTPGGHSSVPHGGHTGIGIMSLLLVALEQNPAPATLDKGHPMLSYLNCAADYGNMDKKLKRRVRNEKKWKQLGEELAASDDILKAFLATTQAIDLVDGGVKVNALPEYTHATINYRINFLSSVDEHKKRIASILEPIVKSVNLTFDAFGSHSDVEQKVVRLIHRPKSDIEPAPLTPSTGHAFDLMSGTIKHIFEGAIVAPSGMVANTDTKWTWNLTNNIFRFVPASIELLKNFHTVDERMHSSAHLSVIRFYYKLIQNTQGWEAE